MRTTPHRIDRQVVHGLLFIALVGLLIAGTVAQYRGAFADKVVVTVEAGRAGLTLTEGAPVKLRGVEIGVVGDIGGEGETVRIVLEIDEDKVDRVPADVTAQIVPPTAFGAKYVQLTAPGSGGESINAAPIKAAPIKAGAVIPATRVTVEVDEAFENLTQVLAVARPAEVNAALTAAAGAVDQRGQLIGDLISRTDTYLASINPSLRTLSSDLRVADDVLDVYEAARPDLVGTLAQGADISDTVVRQHASLRAVERSLTAFSDEADILLRSSERGIVTSLTLFEPVARTLERYAPELPCVVLGLVRANNEIEKVLGGTKPGLTTSTRLLPGREPYTYDQHLPLIGEDRGPVCFGLPDVSPAEAAAPPPVFHTGANPMAGPQPTPSQAALDTLLGLLSGGVKLP